MKYKFKNIVALGFIVLFTNTLSADGLTLKSNDMLGQVSIDQVFNGFGCTGKNISPQLSWTNAPKNTKSFAITMYDPDAPTGSGWWHWIVFNIPKDTNHLSSNASSKNMLPKGSIQSKTDYGSSSFGGACPPKGDKAHTYITTVYALDTDKIDLNKDADSALVGYMINSHVIEKSSIVTYYKR